MNFPINLNELLARKEQFLQGITTIRAEGLCKYGGRVVDITKTDGGDGTEKSLIQLLIRFDIFMQEGPNGKWFPQEDKTMRFNDKDVKITPDGNDVIIEEGEKAQIILHSSDAWILSKLKKCQGVKSRDLNVTFLQTPSDFG